MVIYYINSNFRYKINEKLFSIINRDTQTFLSGKQVLSVCGPVRSSQRLVKEETGALCVCVNISLWSSEELAKCFSDVPVSGALVQV